MADFNDLLISSQTLLPPQSQQLQYSISQLSAVSATVAPPTSLQPQQSYAALHNQEAIAHRFFAGRNFDTENLNSNVMELDLSLYTHLRAHETVLDLVCRLLLEKKKKKLLLLL